MSAVLPIVFGCSGDSLSTEEEAFFRATQPWGFILFKRNCHTPSQVRALCAELRATTNHEETPIFIDQEGGRVARLKPPHWQIFPPARHYGMLYRRNPTRALEAAHLGGHLMADAMRACGVSVNCAPVLDLAVVDAHTIIGDRAFAASPEEVVHLAGAFIAGMEKGGVCSVLKHIPGMGGALADPHTDRCVIDTPLTEHLAPFRALAHAPIAMTSHAVYSALDAHNPATVSPAVLNFIRTELSFHGLLISDALEMAGLEGTLSARGVHALAAGCDVVMYCKATMHAMEELAAALPPLTPQATSRTQNLVGKGKPAPESYADFCALAEFTPTTPVAPDPTAP